MVLIGSKEGEKELKLEEKEMGKLGFWFWVLCGEMMKSSFESENWKSNGWIMSWMIDFNKKMSERWRDLRKKMEGHYSCVNEMRKNKWRNDDGEVFNEDEMHGY